ncbi:GNAT family N-acetyltransferase [Aquimarina litoralis]|uniref:GNAT family N-acetyltransferase n=1 Tax=Aquimarina litoralis TaxID=584605 RepID=UPI001C58426A|nr:GNAT family N-acetyltransferase [Aquimarina litoralis]MBW1296105.1 GNAT family N-acetyltransferase [Aquimarina litoralis]
MITIRLIPKENLEIIIPFLEELNPNIGAKLLSSRLSEMIAQGYECIGVYNNDELIGISGLWFLTKYYVGKHVEPDNVFILPEYQGKGIGELMMNWIFDYAKSKGCVASELNCYVGNKNAHRFWENQGYKKIAYHFQKEL